MNYIPLNIKTEYDLMNSLIRIDDIILYAKSTNLTALGITDTNMFGALEFINKCKANDIKPIIGTELYIREEYFILYAKNYEGFVSLCKIVSKKNLDTLTFEDIKELNKDLICVTSIKHYQNIKEYFDEIYIKYHNDKIKEEALKQTSNIIYMDMIRYFESQDLEYFKIMKLINEGKTIKDKISIYESYYKENNNEEDIKTTYEFSSKINIDIPESTLHIPVYNEDSISYLKALSKKGLEKRLNGNVTQKYKDRLMYELSVIEKMNFTDYFLIVYDFVLFAKKNNITVGPGRGSGLPKPTENGVGKRNGCDFVG